MEILKSLKFPNNIYDTIIEVNNKILKTKHHSETLLEHLTACADNCVLLSKLFNVDFQLAYWTGFLHDIGKPFAIKEYGKNSKKKQLFTGHAQIGSYLIDRLINPENLGLTRLQFKSLLFVVDNHMCCLSHSSKESKIDITFLGAKLGTHLFKLGLPNNKDEREEIIRLSFLLFTSDDLSRIRDPSLEKAGESEKEIDQTSLIETNLALMNYFLKNLDIDITPILNIKKIDNDKIIILPLGISGTGKSSFSKRIKEQISEGYEIEIVERDDCYYEVFQSNNNDIVLEKNIVNYQKSYDFIKKNELSDKVQALWINKLNSVLDSSAQIIIIDTVQTLFEKAWESTIKELSEDARESYYNSLKVGMYLFPQKQLGIDFNHKILDYEVEPNKYHYPLSSFIFPKINLEKGTQDNDIIDIGTGVESQVVNIIDNFMSKHQISNLKQVNMIELIKKYGGLEGALSTFPKGLINLTKEFENQNIELTTITYEDGMQNFKLETRDYRGETIIYDKINKEYFLVRGSLPIFPDFNSIEKDVLTFPYIKGNEHLFNNEKLTRKIKNSDIDGLLSQGDSNSQENHVENYKLFLTPKYDGSLFNLTYINNCSKVYTLINENPSFLKKGGNKIICKEYSIFIIGSKNRLIAAPPVEDTFFKCITSTYGTISNFIDSLDVEKNKGKANITFHFEAIGDNLNNFLTVYYPSYNCQLLGYTQFYDDGFKKFHLPIDMNENNTSLMYDISFSYASIIQFFNFTTLFDYINKKEQELLEGSLEVEPEGYVIHIFDAAPNGDESEIRSTWLPIKYKHDFYYMAHKPYSKRYASKLEEFTTNEKYKLLRQRLLKFKDKKPLKDLVENVIDSYDIINKINMLKDSKELLTKKDWALHWQTKKDDLDCISKTFINTIKEYYPDFKLKLMNIIFSLFGSEIDKEILMNKIL